MHRLAPAPEAARLRDPNRAGKGGQLGQNLLRGAESLTQRDASLDRHGGVRERLQYLRLDRGAQPGQRSQSLLLCRPA